MTKEIMEGNAKIAKFRGMIWNAIYQQWCFEKEPGWYKVEELKFHSSWDWLMPVVEKIREILNATKNKGIFDEYFKDDKNWFTVFFPESIEILFKDVVEFIEWYNLTVTSKD